MSVALIKKCTSVIVSSQKHWKYGAVFIFGAFTSAFCILNYTKNVTGLSLWQLLIKVHTLSGVRKYDKEMIEADSWKKIFPYSQTRPSSELISAWHNFKEFFKPNPKLSSKQALKSTRKKLQMLIGAIKSLPDFVPDPSLDENSFIFCTTENDENLKGYIVKYPGTSTDNGVILYFHGGGFVFGDWKFGLHVLSYMGKNTGCVGISVDYRMPDPHISEAKMNDNITIVDQVQDCIQCYKYLMSSMNIPSKKIFFAGESGGGGLVLLVLQALNKLNIPQPCCAIVMSPACDLSLSMDSVTNNAPYDCLIRSIACEVPFRLAVGEIDVNGNDTGKNVDISDGAYSAMNGDWRGLCPLYFCSSKSEIFYDDNFESAKRAKEAGVDVTCVWSDVLPHGTAFLFGFPEAQDALCRICDWCQLKLLQSE